MATKSNRKKQSLPAQLFKHFNTGISYFLPVIIAGGMLFSFTLITGKIDNGTIVPSNQSFQNIYDIPVPWGRSPSSGALTESEVP